MASVTWEGLQEFQDALRNLPQDATGSAEKIVQAEATAAAFQIRSAYPVRTGNLRDHVTVSRRASKAGEISYAVRNSAKHAQLFEVGTQARHTKIGANRGSMPPGHVFLPIVFQRRRAMFLALIELIVRYGFRVTGDA